MAYDFSNFDQMGASAQMRNYLTQIYPYLLTGGFDDSEFLLDKKESLRLDKQYYFTSNKYTNYPDFPLYDELPRAIALTTRLGVALDDVELRPYFLIMYVSQVGDFNVSSMTLRLNKSHNKSITETNSYNFMLNAINNGETSYYCRTSALYQKYDNNHKTIGSYVITNSQSKKDDDFSNISYWKQNNWVQYGGNYSDYDYFNYNPSVGNYPYPFDVVINSPSYGWEFDTNIPIFDNVDSAMKWVINGDRSDEIKTNPYCNFGLWIDGLKKPIYKLNWHIPALEEENFDFDGAIVEVKAGVSDSSGIYHKLLTSIPYNDGSVGFTWGDFENLGLKTSLLSPYVELTARVVFSDDTKTEFPSVKLKEKALNFEDIYSDITTADDGSTFEVFQGSGENSDDYEPPEDSDDGNDENGDGTFSTSSALTTTYGMTLSRLRGLGQFLWDTSFIENIKLVNNSPIENIISVKAFPFNIDGSDENIKLGNVDTGISGEKTSSNVVTLYKGSVNIDKKYDSFLDFAPYTKVALHLPYIGFVELDTNIIMGKTISIRYIVDLIEGGCMAQVIVNARVINEYKGVMGIDIPITASNRAQVEASHVAGAINAIGNGVIAGISAASGNFVGTAYGIQNSVNSLLDSAMTPYHYSTQGGGTPAVSSGDKANRNIYVIIDRPMYQELSSFNHTRGRLCNLTQRIGHLKGFTSTTPMIDLNGIPCTGAEKEEIRQILSSGFFV